MSFLLTHCSGYEVQFHALGSTASYSAQDDQIPYLPPQLVRPTGSQLISLDAAQRSLLPHSFRVQYDTQSVLPASINIGSDLMGTALKNGTAYSVINVAYTYKVESNNLYTCTHAHTYARTHAHTYACTVIMHLGVMHGACAYQV